MAAYEIKNLPELVRPMLGESEFIGASVAKLTSAGDNYCSLIYAVDITVKDGKEEKILHGVAKMLPQNEYVQKLFNSPRIYFNEVGYYETIVPCLRNFQKEQGFTQLLSSVPDFYGARFSLDPSSDRIDEDAVLLIKNIKAEGFSIIDRRVGFDLVQSELVLEKVAELHSTSIALKLHKPEVFEEKLGPFFQEFQMYVADKTAHENVTKSMLDLIKGDKFCFDNLEKIKDNFNESSSHATTRNDKTFSSPFMSLVHNDMWTNNIMVKIVDGKTVGVKFVDYQIYEYSSLARDVIFFLFNSVQLPVIKEHCDHLLAYYHGQLIKYLKKLKCDVSPFGFEAFLSELQNVAKRLEFFHLILMLRPTWAEDADSTEMENISEKDFQKEKPASEKCKQKGYFIVHEFMRGGWI
jgi:predicted transcriptional regulator